MKQYELVVVLHPDLEIDVDAPVAKITKLIKNAGGRIDKQDNWGKKRLAYPIKKQHFGVYIYFDLTLEPAAIRQIESGLLITEEVIRFLLVNRVQSGSASSAEDQSGDTLTAATPSAAKESQNG